MVKSIRYAGECFFTPLSGDNAVPKATNNLEESVVPNIKSAKKRVKVTEAKALRNQIFKTQMKTIIKKFEAAIVAGDLEVATAAYKVAVKKIDQAVAHGILHKNNAAHKKSSFTKKLNALA